MKKMLKCSQSTVFVRALDQLAISVAGSPRSFEWNSIPYLEQCARLCAALSDCVGFYHDEARKGGTCGRSLGVCVRVLSLLGRKHAVI